MLPAVFKTVPIFCLTDNFIFNFQGIYLWGNRAPVVFQKFTIAEMNKHVQSHFNCYSSKQALKGFKSCVSLDKVKHEMWNRSYPTIIGDQTCTLLLMPNLAQPHWINIDCKEKLLVHIMCQVSSPAEYSYDGSFNKQTLHRTHSCSLGSFYKEAHCYAVLWYQNKTSAKKCRELKRRARLLVVADQPDFVKAAEFLLTCKIPILSFFDEQRQTVKMFSFVKDFISGRISAKEVNISRANGFEVYQEPQRQIMVGNVFPCLNQTYIPLLQVCDGEEDCPDDNHDEIFCQCNTKAVSTKKVHLCKVISDDQNKSRCGSLYFRNHLGMCQQYTTTIEKPKRTEEKPRIKTTQLPCSEYSSQSYETIDICLFSLDESKDLFPCKNGAHLENCEDFDCGIEFKCQKSYCILWSYVHDKKWDCPDGEDEHFSSKNGTLICKNMFKCKKTLHTCIHLGNICDSKMHCPFGDDESSCSLKAISCPQFCGCLHFAMYCESFTGHHFHQEYPFVFVRIHNSETKLLPLFMHFPMVKVLKLPNCNISTICSIRLPQNITDFDLSPNIITRVTSLCFELQQLKTLSLSSNQIQLIEANSLLNLPCLKELSLSHNLLVSLPDNVFHNIKSLKTLFLSSLQMADFPVKLFEGVELDRIETDDFHICCIAPPTALCNSKPPWYLPCGNLLPNHSISQAFISIAVASTICNLATSVLLILGKKKQAFAVSAVSINFTVVLYCVYLVLVWFTNIQHKHFYFSLECKWRTSFKCFLAFSLVLFHSFFHSICTLLLSVSRLMIVVSPMKTRFVRAKFVAKLVFLFTLVCLTLSSMCTVLVKAFLKILPHGLCLPFYDPTHKVLAIEALTIFLSFYLLLTPIAMPFIHAYLVYELSESKKKVQKATDQSNAGLVVQLFVLTATTVLCHFASISTYLYSHFANTYPIEIMGWATVTIVPTEACIYSGVFFVVNIRSLVKEK